MPVTFFKIRDRKIVDLDGNKGGEELGEVVEGNITISIYIERKNSTFNYWGKKDSRAK